MNSATEFYLKNKRILSIDALMDDMKQTRVNEAEVLIQRLDEEIADNGYTLEKFLYVPKQVTYKAKEYYRNEEDKVVRREVDRTKLAYTSNGTERLLDLVELNGRYDVPRLNQLLDEAVKLAVKKSGGYYQVKDNGEAEGPIILDTNFEAVLSNYLRLPAERQNKGTLIAFFKKYEDIDKQYEELNDTNFKELNYLGDAGYEAVMRVFKQYKNQLSVSDMETIGHYVNFRLNRMESVMANFDDKQALNTAMDLMKQYKNGNIPSFVEVDKTIDALDKWGKERYDVLKAKYNHEIQQYLPVVKNIKRAYDEANTRKCVSLESLLYALKTSRVIINDTPSYKKTAIKNDEYKDMLLDIPVKRPTKSRTL